MKPFRSTNHGSLVWVIHSLQKFKVPLASFELTPMQARPLVVSFEGLLSDGFLTRLFTDVRSNESSSWQLLTIAVALAIGRLGAQPANPSINTDAAR